jgi:FKBP-type peptidyl-prolyl cis-trans isomerase
MLLFTAMKVWYALLSILIVAGIITGTFALQHLNKPKQETKAVDTQPTSNQLQSTDSVVGTGAEAKEGSNITVKYTGALTDGTVFDSTEKPGGQPVTFQLAKGSLIAGWVQGIPGMKVGGKRKLVIPPSLGYGSQPNGTIPANSTLVFDIELVDVK